jgi:hypothetical protein
MEAGEGGREAKSRVCFCGTVLSEEMCVSLRDAVAGRGECRQVWVSCREGRGGRVTGRGTEQSGETAVSGLS